MDITYTDSTPLLKVSDMAESLVGSEIIKLAGDVKEKISKGEKIFNFTIGDFDPAIFPIPKNLKEEIIKAYENNETNYPAANGLLELRKAVSRYLHTRGGLEFSEEQILISGGARPLIYSLFQAILDPGDSVVFAVPSWNNNHYCHLSRTKAIHIETSPKNNFMPTADSIKPYIQQASIIALCSPQNPTGTAFNRTQLEKICELILEENKKRGDYKKPVYLMFDQIYWQLTFGSTIHFDPVSLYPEMKNYTIYIDGISKAFAATGVRVGWSFGPQKVIDKMRTILSHIGAWSPKAEQVATAKFMVNDNAVDDYLTTIKQEISDRLNSFHLGFQKLKEQGFKVDSIAPQAAMYLTVQINIEGLKKENGSHINNTTEATRYLLDEAKIALVPFSAFGASVNSTWYRLSVGTAHKHEIDGFFANLKQALSKLSN